MIRISVYDDSPLIRDSLKSLIDLDPEFAYAGGFENCADIIANIEADKPDIILMDIEMPGGNGIDGVRAVKQQFPFIKIIMQTAFDDDDKIFAALQAGAEGYILKSAGLEQITRGIHEVINGGASMSSIIALKVMRYFRQLAPKEEYNLTPKENETLKLLSNGLSYKMIAEKMNITYFTVNSHIRKIYEKLQVNSLGEAVALAHRKRLV